MIKSKLKINKIYILASVCAVMAITSIFMTIESATNGSEIANLQNREAALLAQQQDLQQSLVESLSVNNLQEKSLELGFTKVTALVYVSDAKPVAQLP